MRNGARKTFAWLLFNILITTCRAQSVLGPTCGSQFDFQLEDFGQLKAEMAAPYANLESSQRERHKDLPKLRQETDRKLRRACDEQQAQKNLRGFIEALTGDVVFTGGILPYASPGSFESLESKTTLLHRLRYSYSESTERPPLYVLVDRETWSAAEYFATILQDNTAATIVGELTRGAGCGYTNGGTPAELRHSHAVVDMPDCVCLRKDGSEEVNGVSPDILEPWAKRGMPYTKAVKLSPGLNAALGAESSEPLSHQEWEFRVTKL